MKKLHLLALLAAMLFAPINLRAQKDVPITFEAMEAGAEVSFKLKSGVTGVEYSTDGSTWNAYTSNTPITLVNVGDKVSFRGNNVYGNGDKYSTNVFSCTKDCYIYGNIMSLINATDYASATEWVGMEAFSYLFYNNTHIKNHATKTFKLPATTLSEWCYEGMFYGCTGLTAAPELPATTLAYGCYMDMFYGCTSLTTAPELPATTMATNCYSAMFHGCTGLTAAPELPATTLAQDCYSGMFQGCTSLTAAPELPATTLASSCYRDMFNGCTSLTTAPEVLPATTLADYCYHSMFHGCTGLTAAPELPATTLAERCYNWMFYGCYGLTAAPELPATTLVTSCYESMFQSCIHLNYVVCHATDISANRCTFNWLNTVADIGTLVTPYATIWKKNSSDGIPFGWNATELFPFTDFAIDFRTDPYTVVGGGSLPTGVEVAGTFNDNQHGYYNVAITIPVTEGNYKVTLGACGYGNGQGSITNEDGSVTFASFNQKLEENNKCYHQNTAENIVSMIFNVPADQKIVVDCGNYTPYFSIEKMAAVPAFTDFEVNFQSDPYNVISGAKPEGTVISGSFNDTQHGYTNVEAIVPVEAGSYRLTLGTCRFGNGAGNVLSATNTELASFNQNTGVCYDANPAQNIVSMIFTVDMDQTIAIECGQYTPYMKLEKVKEIPAFKDFAIDLRGQQLGGTNSEGGAKYLIIDSENNYSYVDAEPEAYNAHFVFDNFNGTQHGYFNLLVTVPMKADNYRLTLGTCQYGNGAGNVKSATNAILASFDQNTGACYDANIAENIIVVDFTVEEDQLITIDCGNYTPYMKLERVKEIPAFKDFAIDLRGQQLGGTNSEGGAKYLIIDSENNYSYVDAEPEAYNAHFVFDNFNGSQHGYFNLLVTVPMKAGDYRLTLGTCQYGNGAGNVKSAADAILTSFDQNTGACYDANIAENIIVVNFTVTEDQLITIDCGNYTPYIAVEQPAITLDIEAYEDPEHAGDFYCTFFDSSNKYALPDDGTKAYAAELKGTDLWLHEIASGAEVIPANVAVIFKSPTNSITLTQTDADAVTVSDQNCLLGTDEAMDAPANCYVISGHSSDNSVTGVGFYQYTSTLKAHKAYTIYNGSAAAPKRMRFIFDVATGIDNASAKFGGSEKILENGVLYIIKNGVRYNAQGQMVK